MVDTTGVAKREMATTERLHRYAWVRTWRWSGHLCLNSAARTSVPAAQHTARYAARRNAP